MLLTDWLKQNFTHITLNTVINNKGTILNVPEINVDLTVGLISTDSKGNPDIESNVPLKAKKRVQTKKFANSFSNTLSNYVLTVIG